MSNNFFIVYILGHWLDEMIFHFPVFKNKTVDSMTLYCEISAWRGRGKTLRLSWVMQPVEMMKNYKIIEGYIPGIIGRVAELHAKYYSKEWKFGHYFEAKVATELSSFINSYDETMDCIWSLLHNSTIEGSITIDSSSEDSGIAHLRWFIISENMIGSGAGNHLIKLALEFCEQKRIEKVYLWTFHGLESAKHLYQKHGFKMTQELEGIQWGTSVIEQRYELKIQ